MVLIIATGGDREPRIFWSIVVSYLLTKLLTIEVPQYITLVVIAAARALVNRLCVIIIRPKMDYP